MAAPRIGDIVTYHYGDTEPRPLDGITSVPARVVVVHGDDVIDLVFSNQYRPKVARGDKPNDPQMTRKAWS